MRITSKIVLLAAIIVGLFSGSVPAQQKGGEDETGPMTLSPGSAADRLQRATSGARRAECLPRRPTESSSPIAANSSSRNTCRRTTTASTVRST